MQPPFLQWMLLSQKLIFSHAAETLYSNEYPLTSLTPLIAVITKTEATAIDRTQHSVRSIFPIKFIFSFLDVCFYLVLNTIAAVPLLTPVAISHLQKLSLSVMLAITDYSVAEGRLLVANGIEHFYLDIATACYEHWDINKIVSNAAGLWIEAIN